MGDSSAVVGKGGERKKKGGKSKVKRFELKTPKGTRDFGGFEMSVRQRVFRIVEEVFQRHGAICIDTPSFELKSILTGKYGEESKLIYDLADFGGEELSLRYDLTVPFARFVAQHGISKIKRYQIGRVFRRDEISISQGRYREFYQCDFDYAGPGAPLVPDAEVIRILCELLSSLEVGDFVVKVNHRGLLEAMFIVCGLPQEMFATACSSVDKLDKSPWSEVRKEMIESKGIADSVCDQLKVFLDVEGSSEEVLSSLEKLFCADEGDCESSKRGKEKGAAVLKEMKLFLSYVNAFVGPEMMNRVRFDVSLARGLDYYTGVIFEAIVVRSGLRVGSVAGGGRYDGLVGMFSGTNVPAIGFALGVERIFRILEEKQKESSANESSADVCVICAGPSIEGDPLLFEKRMEVCRLLWNAKIRAEISYATNPKINKQIDYARKGGYPVAVIVCDEGLSNGTVEIKPMVARKGPSSSEIPVVESLHVKYDEKEFVAGVRGMLVSCGKV